MKLIQHDRDRFHVEVKRLGDQERPPMATIPEYRSARQEPRGDQGPHNNVGARSQEPGEGDGKRGSPPGSWVPHNGGIPRAQATPKSPGAR
jgi:hypothetical protein